MVFLVDPTAVADVRNAAGVVIITPASDPAAAIRSAVERWNQIPDSRVNFGGLDFRSTPVNIGRDDVSAITFRDNATTRSIAGEATAVTRFFVNLTTDTIIESDIVFNPDLRNEEGAPIPFSTNGQEGTFDIEATLVHELGHAIGAKHTSVAGGTMWQNGREGELFARTLTPDDQIFAIQAYPRAGALNGYGRIRGVARVEGGAPIKGGLVAAVNPNGTVISALTDLITGEYEIVVPPGDYIVYLDPANDPLSPIGLRIDPQFIDNSFATTLFGGNASPATVPVGPGGVTNADITAPGGAPPLEIAFVGVRDGDFIVIGTGPRELAVNEPTELFLWGQGLAQVEEADVQILGPEASLVPGSVQVSGNLRFNGLPALRMTVRPALASNPTQSAGGSLATVLITRQGMAAAYTGGIVLENLLTPGPAPSFTSGSVTNAASFAPGAVAPGELISIFGLDLGPETFVTSPGFGADGRLPTSLAGVQVTFDGRPAPLFFVSANQINLQTPYEVAGQASTTAVVSYQGRSSPNVSLPVAASAPGVFFVAPGAPAILNQDGSLNSPANPEARGRAVVVFATGQGAVTPPVETGRGAPAAPLSGITDVAATIGGRTATPLFAGLTPGFVGLLQVNLLVPGDAPAGAQVPVSITLRGQTTQSDVNVSIAP